jgi:DNA-binding NtrC family response regulator
MQNLAIAHLDDDPFEGERVRSALAKSPLGISFRVESALQPGELFNILKGSAIDAVLLDVHLGDDVSGHEVIPKIRELAPHAVILMFSTADDAPTVLTSLQAGADDFLSKHSDKGELALRIKNSLGLAQLKRGHKKSAAVKAPKPIGATMEQIQQRVVRLINSAVSAVHVAGESGTGKEVVADLFAAELGDEPFVKVNCGAIAPTILESELFGHVKGAFTGALTDKRGYLESASGGWLFLDEVANLTASAQAALLRVIENQEVLRVGSAKPVPIKVRIISATNDDLDALVEQGKFRRDLLQRLREAEIKLRPLRDRRAEIPDLVAHFCHTMPGGPYKISDPALRILTHAKWREGNVRELRNCLRAMTEMHENGMLTPLSIPERVLRPVGKKTGPAADLDFASTTNFDTLVDRLLINLTEHLYLQHGQLSIRQVALLTNVSRSTLSARYKQLVESGELSKDAIAEWLGIR